MSKLSQNTVQQLAGKISLNVLSEYTGAHGPLIVQPQECGHEFVATYSALQKYFKKHGNKPYFCKVCSGKAVRTTSSVAQELLSKYNLELLSEYVSMKTNVSVKSLSCGHSYETNLGHLLYSSVGSACKVCSGTNTVKSRFFTRLLEANLELMDEYTTSQLPLLVMNKLCNHTYTVIPNNLVCANSGVVCRVCDPISTTSSGEKELLSFIKSSYSGAIKTSDRTVLKGKEIDIYLPDIALGIEFNGQYWHQEDMRGQTYHKIKAELAEAAGIKLVQVNSDEWEFKPLIVKSRISSMLQKSFKVWARHCTVKKLNYFPGMFLEGNHIQGAGAKSSHNYGLFLKEELVGVMTFSKPRFNGSYDFELIRFCTLLDITVVGGAGKLLKAFYKEHGKVSVISYADRRWSTGGLYKALGFKKLHETAPNYKYYKTGYATLSRYQCQKHLLKNMFPEHFSDSLTEKEIMSKARYFPVYDAGNSVWVTQ